MNTIDLVFQYPYGRLKAEGFDSFPLKGKWHEFFGNHNPIVLELGCGKGEYTVGLARLFPEKNFIGIDIKGARMHKGATEARDAGMTNVAFLRTQIELIASFMNLYRSVMTDGGVVRLKTDSPFLYQYTKAMAELNRLAKEVDTDDLYHSDLVDPILAIRTHYESQWLARGLTIKYLAFALDHATELQEPEDDFDRDTYRSYSRGYIDNLNTNNI